PKVLPKAQPTVEVKVQAINRGEEEITPLETLVVMPRPIPGIKSVSNPDATRFSGKRRETDEELRDRAKNTLISSGKATLLSIENALLSLPSVKDVKVRENFHFAQGQVTLTREVATEVLIIPKGTLLNATVATLTKPFLTTEQVRLEATETAIAVAVQSTLEGKAGELTEIEGVTWQVEGDPPLDLLTATHTTSLVLGQFGIIEVFVDGLDFNDAAAVDRLNAEIERVRAAGIFVLLKSAIAIQVDGIFQIEASPDLKLSAEDRLKLETQVKDVIIQYIEAQKMGQPLLFSQIVRSVLSLTGINNLEEFVITTQKPRQDGTTQTETFTATDKRIETQEFEKFTPRYLCVASEIKPLPIHLQFKIEGLDKSTEDTIRGAIATYFSGLKVGDPVDSSAIATQITTAIAEIPDVTLIPNTLKLSPQPWCQTGPNPDPNPETAIASFVEQATLGNVFAYSKQLRMTGALKLTLPSTLTDAENQSVRDQVQAKVADYLEGLTPEADVVFADIVAIAAAVVPVVAVDVDPNDFQVLLDDTETVGRVSAKKIDVQAFEKPVLDHFCAASGIEPVQITFELDPEEDLTDRPNPKPIELELVVINPPPEEFDENATKKAIQRAVRSAANAFLANAKPGQTINYANFKTALENRVPNFDYSVKHFSLKATSACDGRVQVTSIDTAKNIQIRSVEIAAVQPIPATQSGLDAIISVTI
ncbi:MAG: baseplate J/gp47 family protein, partial [Thermosynechococcaceae cyanobacterium]